MWGKSCIQSSSGICIISSDYSSFIFDIDYFCLPLVILVKDLSILLIFAKNQLLIKFFSLLFITLFISDLIFIVYFLVLTLGFNYFSFSSFLNWKLSKIFFPINTYAFNAEYFTLIFVFAAPHKF